ncbi:EAL domain-containing protein [Pseudaeromonas sp. ZJS20]|uniref:EAL domain-containing protein n=1 Tax=Pseudaeromonas aegiceratis TaxID=3153928 RepID=UPI00390CBF1F
MRVFNRPVAWGGEAWLWHCLRVRGRWLAACLLLLLLLQLGMTWWHRQRLDLEAGQVMAEGLAVAQQLGASLERLAQSEAPPCSMEDYALMAQILRDYQYTADIGRTVGDRLLCTALRGQLAVPIALPAPDFRLANGFSFLTAHRLAPRDPIPLDLTLYRGGVAFTPPLSFDSSYLAPEHSFYLLDGQLRYLFRILGKAPAEGGAPAVNWFTGLRRCSADGILCVVAQDRQPWLYQQPYGVAVLGLVVLGLGWGCLCGLPVIPSQRRLRVQALRRAIFQQQIQVWYQPQIQMATGKVTGFEALSRWQSDSLGNVPPSEFIPLAEQAGLIHPLTLHVLKQAVDQCAVLLRRHRSLTLSINLVLGPALTAEFFDKVRKRVLSRGGRCEQLVFEITETSAVGFANIQVVCDAIKRSGFRLSLDDFGTGFSNLSWLSHLHADEIKIDKMFIQALGEEGVAGRTADMLLSLTASLPSVAIVLEGVETQAQVERLTARGRHWIAQGWYYAKAMRSAELAGYIAQHGVAEGVTRASVVCG